jgi:hypothetical protein
MREVKYLKLSVNKLHKAHSTEASKSPKDMEIPLNHRKNVIVRLLKGKTEISAKT